MQDRYLFQAVIVAHFSYWLLLSFSGSNLETGAALMSVTMPTFTRRKDPRAETSKTYVLYNVKAQIKFVNYMKLTTHLLTSAEVKNT
jgi:hypothetical protein